MSEQEDLRRRKLGAPEERYIDRVARNLGGQDIEDLARTLGYPDSRELAKKNGFNDMYAFFSADGGDTRYLDLRKALTAARRAPRR